MKFLNFLNVDYKKPFVFAAIVELAAFFLLFATVSFEHPHINTSGAASAIIQAVTVDQTKVQEQVNQIKTEAQAKQAAEDAQQKYLKQLAQQAKAQQKMAKQQQALLKMQQKKLEQQRAIEQQKMRKQMADLKKEQQRLNQLQAQRKSQETKTHQTLNKSLEEKLLEQQLASEQKALSDSQNQQLLTEMEKYKGLILNAIGQAWKMPANVNKELSTRLLIQLAPGGMVIDVKMLKSSGDSVLDRSVINAVWKASPLPVPTDLVLFEKFRELRLTVKPEGMMGR